MYTRFFNRKYTEITWLLLRLPCIRVVIVNDMLKPADTLTCLVSRYSLWLDHCSFKEKILSNGVDLWICTWFVLDLCLELNPSTMHQCNSNTPSTGTVCDLVLHKHHVTLKDLFISPGSRGRQGSHSKTALKTSSTQQADQHVFYEPSQQ